MMKIGPKMLTLAAMAALSVGAVFAQGTASKPAKASMASKMTEEQPTPQSGQKKMDKHVHGHHHKNKKHTSKTSTQDTTTKK